MKTLIPIVLLLVILTSCSTTSKLVGPEQPYKVISRPIYHNCKVYNCPQRGKIVGYEKVFIPDDRAFFRAND